MLEIDWGTLLLQILNFIALLLILNYLVFKPLRAKLAERRRSLSETFQAAQDQEAEAERLRRDWEMRRSQVEREAEEIIQTAEAEAQRRAAQILQEARIRLDQITSEIREDLVRQRNEILVHHYDRVLDTVIALSANVIRAITTRRAHDDLVTNFCASIYQIPQDQVETYRQAMAGRAPIAFVETPVELTLEQVQTLTDTLSSLIDRRVELQVTINPALIAGVQVRLADRLIGNSVRQHLLRIRDLVRQDLVAQVESVQ